MAKTVIPVIDDVMQWTDAERKLLAQIILDYFDMRRSFVTQTINPN